MQKWIQKRWLQLKKTGFVLLLSALLGLRNAYKQEEQTLEQWLSASNAIVYHQPEPIEKKHPKQLFINILLIQKAKELLYEAQEEFNA
ncbi:MAG TPA: hypothetical protein DCM08_04220 [Microscillaceae bacterium]|jgi:hypothetical protein|nr:hypothetical protein [Microscillaceae bacterium]